MNNIYQIIKNNSFKKRMPSFLSEIDNKFNLLVKKKTILNKNDLLELKSFIINVYENDTNIDIKELKNNQRKILFNDDSDNENE